MAHAGNLVLGQKIHRLSNPLAKALLGDAGSPGAGRANLLVGSGEAQPEPGLPASHSPATSPHQSVVIVDHKMREFVGGDVVGVRPSDQ
jgi:hypothetical protein